MSLEQILTVKHWLTLKQTVTTSKFLFTFIPKGMRIKQMNQQIKNSNARINRFPEATSFKLLHYLYISLDKYTDTVVFS